jgi:hypothetical protein
MPFASSAFGQLAYIAETTAGIVPVAGNATRLRTTGPTMKASTSTVKSAEVSSHRMSTDQALTDMNVDGGFNFELSGREYDPFLEAVLLGSWNHYGTNGLGTPFSATMAAGSIVAAVAPTTTSAFTNIGLGQWFKVVAPVGASQAIRDYFSDRWFKSHAVTPSTATQINLDASTPIAAPGLGALGAGYAISSSSVQNGSVQRSFSMEYQMTDIAQFMTYAGMRPGMLELSIDTGAIITGAFGFLGGADHTMQGATRLPGTVQPSQTLDVMNGVTDIGAIYEAGVSVLTSTSSFIKSVKFNLSQNLRGQKAVGVFGNAGVGLGEFAVGGTLDLYVENATYYNKWLRNTRTSLAVGMADSLGNGYLVEMENVKFGDAGLNTGGLSDDTMLSLPFNAFYNQSSGRGVRITRAVAA